MESNTSEASTSTSPIAFNPPRPWENAVPRKSILKRPPPPSKSFFNLGGFTRDILPGSLSKFIHNSSASSVSNSRPQSPTAGSFRAAGAGLLLPSAVPYDDSSVSSQNGPSPLKRAHFILPHMSTVYLISSSAAPSSAELTEARREIEERERELRNKEREEGAGAWSLGRVEEFYRECCKTRDENALGGVIGAFRQANLIPPRTLDLTSVKLSPDAAAALADVFSIEWGLRKLILRDCDLDEHSLKPLLHALLIPGSLPYLSLSSNKRMKAPAFRLVGVFISKSDTLEFLDLSQNPLDKRSVEYIVSALQPAPASQPPPANDESSTSNESNHGDCTPSGRGSPLTIGIPDSPASTLHPASPTILSPTFSLSSSPQFPPLRSELSLKGPNSLPEKVQLLSLRLDECQLRGGALDVLAHAIRTSSIQNLSLRSNRIGPTGAVSLALMIKDYPDSLPSISQGSPSSTSNLASPTASNLPRPNGVPMTPPLLSTQHPFMDQSIPGITTPPLRSGPSLPPPRHPAGRGFAGSSNSTSTPAPQTTYTPYIPRSKRNMILATGTPIPPSAVAQSPASPPVHTYSHNDVPTFTSSRAGGVTTRHPGVSSSAANPASGAYTNGSVSGRSALVGSPGAAGLDGHSAALLDRVRSLDSLPRLGALQALDLRGNDLRNGVTYIAQVLKRNRTLKVLNLSDNRVDVNGFVAIAEALKYNSTLETLDMSRNPCCGPSLEGVTAIRTAFTINTALKRLFLSSTGLTSSGAIALAEFLPDARRLLHLDLTQNTLDIAGVMALSVGLKVNRMMRCLDVNVPPNDAEMARLSREILRCCVRNTELVADMHIKPVSSSAMGAGMSSSSSAASFVDVVGEVDPDGEMRGSSSLSMSEDLDLLFGNNARGGVWGLIERSELARGVKQDVERERVGLERQARGQVDGKQKLDIWKKSPEEVMKAARDLLREAHSPSGDESQGEVLLERGSVLSGVVVEMVQVEKDPARLEELLELNDRLTGLIKDLKTGHAPYSSERPSVTRRNSKGKEKAAEKVDIVLSPSFSITDSDDEDDQVHASAPHKRDETESELGENAPDRTDPSPTVLSKSWMEEEGEIFRRGNVLLKPDELGEEGADISSEELKRELLEAQVERPRPRLEEDLRRSDEDLRGDAPP